MIIPFHPYLERYRNEGTRTYSRHSDYSEAETVYQPGGGVDIFALLDHFISHLSAVAGNPEREMHFQGVGNPVSDPERKPLLSSGQGKGSGRSAVLPVASGSSMSTFSMVHWMAPTSASITCS